jgi:hypothetical protein
MMPAKHVWGDVANGFALPLSSVIGANNLPWMEIIAKPVEVERALFRPLRGPALAVSTVVVWVAGAAYCHGYQNLLTGLAYWPGSFIWSAIAVLPWFGLFEWSKSSSGGKITASRTKLAGLLLAMAAASIATEFLVNWVQGDRTSPVALLIMRRLPAIAATLMLIELARKYRTREAAKGDAGDLRDLAGSIEYIAAADNYIELHLPGRVALRRMTLTEAADLLSGHGFLRVHRRFLVSRAYIDRLNRHGRGAVRLRSGAELPIGRAYSRNIPGWR